MSCKGNNRSCFRVLPKRTDVGRRGNLSENVVNEQEMSAVVANVANEWWVLRVENADGNDSSLRPKVERLLPPPAVVTR